MWSDAVGFELGFLGRGLRVCLRTGILATVSFWPLRLALVTLCKI